MNGKILCAADFREASRWAVAHAEEMAQAGGAELLLCHVIESPYRYAGEVVYAEPGSRDEVMMSPEVGRLYEERLREAFGDRLDGRVRLIVKNGAPEVEILRLARRERADLIVVGRGQGTAPQVLERARCPVLLATGPGTFTLTGRAAEPSRLAAAA